MINKKKDIFMIRGGGGDFCLHEIIFFFQVIFYSNQTGF